MVLVGVPIADFVAAESGILFVNVCVTVPIVDFVQAERFICDPRVESPLCG